MGVACTAMKKPSEGRKIAYESLASDESNPSDRDIKSRPGNPGTWDELHNKVFSLCPVNIQGLQLILGKNLSEHFRVNHVLTLSNTIPTGYKFEGNYTGTKRIGPYEKYPIIKGSIMPNGNMSGLFVHSLGCRFRVKLSSQIDKSEFKNCSSTLEYRSDDFTVSSKVGNVDFLKRYGVLNMQYLQALSPRLALGAQVTCLRESDLPNGYQTALSAAFRYSTGPKTFSAIFGKTGLHLSYHHVASDQLQLGVEVESDMKMHHTSSQIVYQINMPKDDILFKGVVTSEFSIGGVLEKKLMPYPNASLLLSCYVNHRKDRLFVGIGFNIK